MKKAWVYIIANCVIALAGVLANVAWPNLVGPQTAAWIVPALAAANAIAHSLAGAGPASGTSK